MDSFDFFPPPIFSPHFQNRELPGVVHPQYHELPVALHGHVSEEYQPLSAPFAPLEDFNFYSTDNDGYSSPSLQSLVELETMRSFSSSSSNSTSPEHFSSTADEESIPEQEYMQVQLPPPALPQSVMQVKPEVVESKKEKSSASRKSMKRKKPSSTPAQCSSPVEGGGVEDAAAKRRRLLRKAELARLSRKRKKTKLGDLEDQVKRLQDELMKAREQLQKGIPLSQVESVSIEPSRCITPVPIVAPKLENCKDLLSVSLAPLPVKDDAEMSNIEQTIQAIVDMSTGITGQANVKADAESSTLHSLLEHFALLHLRRSTYADVHLSSVQHLLASSVPLQFLTWIMAQPDPTAASGNAANASLYSTLFQDHLGVVSDEQKIELNALRTTIRKQHKWDAEMRKAWHKLDVSIRKSMKQQNENLERLRAILTEDQMQKYIVWVKQYGEVCLKIQA